MNEAPTILLIDDDPGFAYLVQRYAQTSGVRFVGAAELDDALTLARSLQPVLILIDLTLPPIDGWQIVQALRAEQSTRAIPLAICSSVLDQARAWEEGADYCLPKPVMYSDFLAVLTRAGVSIANPIK